MLGSIESGEPRALARGDSRCQYAAPGYLLFVSGGRLMALSFDAKTLQTEGEPRVLVDQVSNFASLARASFSASQQGTLLYGPFSGASHLQWFDRQGRDLGLVAQPRPRCRSFRLSPDGRRLAVSVDEPATSSSDLWIIDLERDTIPIRLTSHPGNEFLPVWSPDGTARCIQRGLERHAEPLHPTRRGRTAPGPRPL